MGERGRRLAERLRAEIEGHGVAVSNLLRCQDEGPDGTRLGGCVKLYLDDWGMVFTRDVSSKGELRLLCVAVGVRHTGADSPRWSVYQFAHRRLHGR